MKPFIKIILVVLCATVAIPDCVAQYNYKQGYTFKRRAEQNLRKSNFERKRRLIMVHQCQNSRLHPVQYIKSEVIKPLSAIL